MAEDYIWVCTDKENHGRFLNQSCGPCDVQYTRSELIKERLTEALAQELVDYFVQQKTPDGIRWVTSDVAAIISKHLNGK